MGWFKPKISKFEASIERDSKGRIVQIDTVTLSAKEIRKLEKLEEKIKKANDGGKSVKSFADGVSDIMKGHGDSKHKAYGAAIIKEATTADHSIRVPNRKDALHPSEWKNQVRKGKIQPSVAEAAGIKKSDPKLYEQILQREAKRQGLI